jgi:hypothetical protein
MLNEFAYCPRLWYLEWVQGESSDKAGTFRSSAVLGGGGTRMTRYQLAVMWAGVEQRERTILL